MKSFKKKKNCPCSKGEYCVNGLKCTKENCFLLKTSILITIPVKNFQAASWFYPNTVTIWKKEKYIKNLLSKEERKKISDEIFKIKNSNKLESNITWKMRRIVIKK